MELKFYKYQGTGNDFILIDNRNWVFPADNTRLIAKMCHRRMGIGADGLILLQDSKDADFEMKYFNSDGNASSMCGNGGRCACHFADFLKIISDTTEFIAIDGMHKAKISDNWVSLKMNDLEDIVVNESHSFLNTGSPHHVEIVPDLRNYDVYNNGRNIRNSIYGAQGANVNFVEQEGDAVFSVRTYERGVEDETLSCGTGVTAVALAMYEIGKTQEKVVTLNTPGGQLQVKFEKEGSKYINIFLEGPAIQVYKGIWKI